MSNKIVLFQNGSWLWESEAKPEWLEDKHILITVGDGFTDRDISQMINSYYMENLDYIFDKEIS